MAEDPQAAVADPEPAAPPAEPQAQAPEAPESQPAGKPESESGEEDGAGAKQLLAFLSKIDSPEAANAIFEAIDPKVRSQTAILKDERGKARQSGRQEVINEQTLRQRDEEEYRSHMTRRDEAVRALAGELEPGEVSRYAKTLRESTEAAREGELKRDSFRVITEAPGVEQYGDEEIARLHNVDGAEYPRWLSEHFSTYGDFRERQGYEKGLAEAQASSEGAKALQESLQRGEAPPPVPAGGTASDSTSDEARLDRIVAGTYTEQDRAWYSQRYGRNPASRR